MFKMYCILIDSGTTNSRIRLVEEATSLIKDSEKVKVGVRNTAIEGNSGSLKLHLKEGLRTLLQRNFILPKDINYIVASGMITSNLGIYEVPHVIGPAQVNDFVEQSKVIIIEDFFNIPCIFVPGLSNQSISKDTLVDEINQMDVMRGEEVESIGIMKQLQLSGKGIIVLPGSHTKFVIVDANQSIVSCLSTLGGEILMALQRETILSNSLSSNLVEEVDKELLTKGFNAAKEYGLTRSFYHVRLLQLFSNLSENQRANYFVGAVIHDDIRSLLQTVGNIEDMEWIVVGGSNPLRGIFSFLLSQMNENWKVIEATDDQVENSLVLGAQEIANKIDVVQKMNENKQIK